MTLWKQFIQKLKSPPPERLAYIEYQSHFINIAGVLIVALILVLKGYWYVILAFIFSIGVSYSQGMAALNKYRVLTENFPVLRTPQQVIEDIEREKSGMRRRRKTLLFIAGRSYSWLIMLLAILFSMVLINPFGARWYLQVLFVLMILPLYIILYFGIAYKLVEPLYERRKRNALSTS